MGQGNDLAEWEKWIRINRERMRIFTEDAERIGRFFHSYRRRAFSDAEHRFETALDLTFRGKQTWNNEN